jgi:cellulose synthase/poly-beta-1,6-N-acetylglucosamine synthase-like glycosyltransferase
MLSLLYFLLNVAALALLAAALFLFLEVIASFGVRGAPEIPQRQRGRIGVVIPAHNEQAIVAATVAAVRAELRDVDRIIVVADNCNDDTAAMARPAGADAIERKDNSKCGKGYALQFGVDHLRQSPPDTVIFIDADCRPGPGAIARIAERADYLQRPVQALYLMQAPDGSDFKSAVSAFAWLLMNRVRMSGLQRISGATRLTGSGMAFPWALISSADLASGEIVEDLALTVKMIEAGAPPFLDLGATVTSELALSDEGAMTQRARWEHGSLRMAARTAPRLFLNGLRGDGKSLSMAFDLAVPPLTIFAVSIAVVLALGAVAALFGAAGALKVALLSFVLFAGAVTLGWLAYGREVLPLEALKGVGPYLLGKARVYGADGRRSARRWTRTDRGAE